MGQRVGLGDVACRAADDDDELRLVVELLRLLLGGRDLAAAAVERRVVLVEQDRLLRHGVAGLGRVLAIVEADADDLLRVGDARAELGLVLGNEMRRRRLGDEAPEASDVALPGEHGRDRRRRAFLEGLLGGRHVEDAALGLEAEAVVGAMP